MSIQNVKKLVKLFESDREFRIECFRKNPDDLIVFLNAKNLVFDPDQMEDSLRLQVLNTQSYSEAHRIFEVYDVLRGLLAWPTFEFELVQTTSQF